MIDCLLSTERQCSDCLLSPERQCRLMKTFWKCIIMMVYNAVNVMNVTELYT